MLNAGSHQPVAAKDFKADELRRLIELNVMGVANGIEVVLPGMIERNRGRLAVVASVAGYSGLPTSAYYGCTKGGVINMVESLAFDLRGTGVKLQLINPGFVKTPLTDKNDFAMPFLVSAEEAAQSIAKGLAERPVRDRLSNDVRLDPQGAADAALPALFRACRARHQQMTTAEWARAYARYFDELSEASKSELRRLAHPDIHFVDPFNDVRGIDKVCAVFDHMFETSEAPRFVTEPPLIAGDVAFIKWRFTCRIKSRFMPKPLDDRRHHRGPFRRARARHRASRLLGCGAPALRRAAATRRPAAADTQPSGGARLTPRRRRCLSPLPAAS